MASTALLGFLKGASGSALDSMELREKEAAERRKLQLAAQIDHEYFTKRELFKEGLPSNVLSRKERQRKMEREEELHPLQVEAGRLGLDSTRQEMELARNRDARADRLTDAQIESYRASAARSRTGLDSDSAPVGSASLGAELVNAYKDTVNDLTKSAGVPRHLIERGAAEVVARTRARLPEASGEQLMEASRAAFLGFLERMGTGQRQLLDEDGDPVSNDQGIPVMAPWDPDAVIRENRRRSGLGG